MATTPPTVPLPASLSPSSSLHPAPPSSPPPAKRPRTSTPPLPATTKHVLRSLLRLLNLDSRCLTRLSAAPSVNSAHAFLTRVLHALAPMVYPDNPSHLLALFHNANTPTDKLAANVVVAMNATKRGTMARRYVRSLLCGSMSRGHVNRLLAGNALPPASEDDDEGVVRQPDGVEIANATSEASPKHSNSPSVTASKPEPPSDSSQLPLLEAPVRASAGAMQADDDDDSEDAAAKGVCVRITGKTFSRARRDWDVLRQCGELYPAKYGRSKVPDASLKVLLSFLFHPNNVLLTSWVDNRIVIPPLPAPGGGMGNAKLMQLPALVPAKNGSVLHQQYCQHLKANKQSPLSRGSFYAVLNTLTRRHITRVLPIDNATRCLVKDPLTLLRDLIIRLVPYADRAQYLRDVDKVEWFSTWSFAQSHLGLDDGALHDYNFALKSSTLLSDLEANHSRIVTCRGCVFPLCVIEEIVQLAQLDQREHVKKVAKQCMDRFISYLSYTCRRMAQQKGLTKAVNEIQTKNMTNRIVVFVDYIHSEFVKRQGKQHCMPNIEDVAFHGSAVYFLDKKHDPNPQPTLTSAPVQTKTELKCLFYQHVVNTTPLPAGNARDQACVPFILEALLRRIHTDIPYADEVIFVTDNGSLYKNHLLSAYLPHLTRSLRIRTVRLLRTCAQSCEFINDAIYSMVATRVLTTENRSAPMTAEQYAALVNEKSNEINTVCEVLALDEQCTAFAKKFAECKEQTVSAFPAFVGTANDISYQDWQSPDAVTPRSLTTDAVKARVYQFAGTGKGEAVDFDDSIFTSLRQQDAPEESQVAAAMTVPPLNTTPLFPSVSAGMPQSSMAFAIETSSLPITSQAAAIRRMPTDLPWTGPVTGVKVRVSSKEPRTLHRAVTPAPDKVSGGLIADTLHQISSIGMKEGDRKLWPESTDDLIGVHAVKTGVIGKSCSECNRSFKSERFLNSHQCKGPPADKDISARAVILADDMFKNGELEVFRNSAEHLWKGSIVSSTDMDEETKSISGVEYGWAANEIPSGLVESNAMHEYRKEVFAMLDSKKGKPTVDSTVIFEELKRRHAERDDVPSPNVVSNWCELRKAAWRIQPFCQIGLDGTAVVTYEEEADNGPGKSRMKDRYIAKLSEMHEQQLRLSEAERPKPRYMFKEFEDYFKDEDGRTPPDFPEMKQVMNKINALRSKSKRSEVR